MNTHAGMEVWLAAQESGRDALRQTRKRRGTRRPLEDVDTRTPGGKPLGY